MEAKFTKGEWQLEYDDDEGEIFILMGTRLKNAGYFHSAHEVRTYDCTYPEDKSHEEMMANSQLMAASPLLYEALEAATEAYAYHYGEDCPLTIKCRNALRAARGEE